MILFSASIITKKINATLFNQLRWGQLPWALHLGLAGCNPSHSDSLPVDSINFAW